MRYCKNCLEPDTRPDSDFDDNGVCLPCRYSVTHSEIDWSARRSRLEEIADWARSKNVSGYDCIVPVSGGKDSHRQAIYCRDELGLKPLLVSCAYPPEEQTHRGAANIVPVHGGDSYVDVRIRLFEFGIQLLADVGAELSHRRLGPSAFMPQGNGRNHKLIDNAMLGEVVAKLEEGRYRASSTHTTSSMSS